MKFAWIQNTQSFNNSSTGFNNPVRLWHTELKKKKNAFQDQQQNRHHNNSDNWRHVPSLNPWFLSPPYFSSLYNLVQTSFKKIEKRSYYSR